MCVITNTVSLPISLQSARPWRYFKRRFFFSFPSSFFPSLSFNVSLLHSHCPSLLHHPSHRASLPFTLPIIFSTSRPPPPSSPSILSLFPLLLLHDTFFSMIGKRKEKTKAHTNTCLLAARLSPASPNLSLLWHWLAGASAVLVLAGSSRWGIAVPLNQCPAVREACARHTVQQQQQQQQPSALAALHEAEHGDGMTFRRPGPAGETHTHARTNTSCAYFLCKSRSFPQCLQATPRLHLSSAEANAPILTMEERR